MKKRTAEERVAQIEAQLAKAKAALADVCDECHGTGRYDSMENGEVECSYCDGTGQKSEYVEPVVAPPAQPICPRCASDLPENLTCVECGWIPLNRTADKTLPTFQEMAERVHIANHRWWIDLNTGMTLTRNVGELLMLVVTELSEAVEGHRKNLQDDKLPHRKMFEVELADAVIRLLDIAGGLGLEFNNIQVAKLIPTNIAECLLQITAYAVQAYEDQANRIDFSYWVESAITAIERLAEREQLDLWGAYEEKMAYNAVRYDHTDEGRKAADGKKY